MGSPSLGWPVRSISTSVNNFHKPLGEMIIGESVLELSVVMYVLTASKFLFSWIIPTSKMDRWLQICNMDIMKFLSTCNLLMWNSRVCRLWFNWISFKSNCLRAFLFWDASILVKLVSLEILWPVVVGGFDLTWVCPHYPWVIGHSHWYCLILQKAIWRYCQKQIILTFMIPALPHCNCHQILGPIFSWIGIVNWLLM